MYVSHCWAFEKTEITLPPVNESSALVVSGRGAVTISQTFSDAQLAQIRDLINARLSNDLPRG